MLMLMTRHYRDLGSASDWLNQIFHAAQPIRNQKHYSDLGSDVSSVWNFCACFSDVISGRNHWWHRGMSAVFSGVASSGGGGDSTYERGGDAHRKF